MNFEKSSLQNQIPEWSGKYISSKALEKLINDAVKADGTSIDDDIVIDFLTKLDLELAKVNDFFLYKRANIERWLGRVNEQNAYFDPEFLDLVLKTRDEIYKLLRFADVNKKGFIEILNKFDKKLGREDKEHYLETKVNVLPFTSNTSFTEILDSVDFWIQKVNHQDEQNIEFTTKVRLQQINLTEEQNKILSDTLLHDNVVILKDLINQIIPDLSNKKDPDILSNLQSSVKKTLTLMLHRSCQARAMKCIKLLLNFGASIVDDDDINGRSLIHKLVIRGGKLPKDKSSPLTTPTNTNTNNVSEDIELITWILKNLSKTEYSKVSFKDTFGRRPLHYAAISGFEKLTKILLEFLIKNKQFPSQQGINDPSWFDNDGLTPLLYAVLRGHTTVVNCIIKASNIKNVDAITTDSSPLIRPTSTTINPVLPYSISHSHTQTLLAIACKFGHSITAKLLLSYDADPDIQDEEGETPLHLATRNGFGDCVRLLVGLNDNIENMPDDIKKANTEIKENFYGWTPLFLAAVGGHTKCVEVLIRAGANPNVLDNSGWNPHIHAVFRGHIAVKEILRPLTVFEDPSPLFSNTEINSEFPNQHNSASAEFTYGHNYLQDQSLILVTLGNISDIRKNINPVELYDVNNAQIPFLPSTSVSLIVSAENATGEPVVIDLPTSSTSYVDPIMFYSDNTDKVTLTFDIVPTYGTKKQFIGRATALLSSVKTGPQHSSLKGSVTIPILNMNSFKVIGRLVFEFLIVKAFKHKNLTANSNHTYWTATKIIGHRGLGKNHAVIPNFLQIGENTLISFITAGSLGAEYVEFDVQLTKDHVPIIYHDWTITETGYDIPIHAITLQQFLKIKEQRFGEKPLVNYARGDNTQDDTDQQCKKRVKRSNSVPAITLTPLKRREEKLKGNGEGTIQAPFATLEETFKQVPIHIGFNVEVKYPIIDEAEEAGLPEYHTELNLFVDTILQCVYDNAQEERKIIFSSFHPSICQLLAFKQPNYPVFFLSDCGEDMLADARCNSLQEAIRFAKSANLLGIVTKNVPIIEAPKLVKTIKEAGLLLFTYGSMNNNVQNVHLQRKAGVDAVIVDSVLAVKKGLDS